MPASQSVLCCERWAVTVRVLKGINEISPVFSTPFVSVKFCTKVSCDCELHDSRLIISCCVLIRNAD